jgi:hypothetical protein
MWQRGGKIPEYLENVGEGWRGLLEQAARDIQAADPSYSVFQVKEKFGGLRLYLECNEAAQAIASAAESASLRTCEVCGRPGRMNNGPWYKTLCEEHMK